MTWPEDRWDENRWDEDDAYPEETVVLRWPLDWRGLYPHERWRWFEQLWNEVCMLHDRYRLPIRSGWWENELQLETLAALSGWVSRYDSGEWDDPPGKLALLYDLERVSALLRDGADPFSPDRDREAFIEHLRERGFEPPTTDGHRSSPDGLPPSSNGLPPSSNGFPPSSNGFPPSSNGFPPSWYGFPPSPNGRRSSPDDDGYAR